MKEWPNEGLESPSTPGFFHKRPDAYLAEILMLNRGVEVKPHFWRDKKNQESYKGFIMQTSAHIKYAGFEAVFNAITSNKSTSFDEQTINSIMQGMLSV